MYLSPESQLLFLFFLCDFILCKLLARDFALVEACEVFFARGGVELDFLRVCVRVCGRGAVSAEVTMRSWKIVAGIWGLALMCGRFSRYTCAHTIHSINVMGRVLGLHRRH
jgi:hypothetical protein